MDMDTAANLSLQLVGRITGEDILRFAVRMADDPNDPNLLKDIERGSSAIHSKIIYQIYLQSRAGELSDTALGNLERYLIASVYKEDIEMATYFLEKGADPRKMTDRGCCAMEEAISSGNIEMIELFQSYDLNIKEPSS